MPLAPLVPARLAYAADGTPYSEAYGDVYHSAAGGIEQARRVFLAGNGLPERWAGRGCFVILETGFGLGLNFLAAWSAWRADPRRCARLHYLAAEKHPFSREDLATLHAGLPELAAPAAELRAAWPMLVPGYHRLQLDGGRVVLTLMFGDIADTLPKLRARADAIYLDGFAPAKNPDMWSPRVFRSLALTAAPGATLATWTVAAAVREGLGAAGFATEKRPGFGPKREMLAGQYAPQRPRSKAGPLAHAAPPAQRRALVLGAGIAGSAVAERLAARGWAVTVVDRRPVPGGGPLDPIAGVFKPLFSRDDNIASRLSRAGCLAALRHWQGLADAGLPLAWAPCGVLQVARNAQQARDFADILAAHRYPEDFVAPVSPQDAARLAGRGIAGGGMLIRAGGWINPISLCAGNLLRHASARILWGRETAAIERRNGTWRALERGGAVIAEAPLLVLANAWEANAFPQAALPFRRVRGQATFLPPEALGGLGLVVCREGCVTPAAQGVGAVGSTFDPDDDPAPRIESHASNLERLERLLPGAAAGLDPARLDGRVGFRTATPDRLPLAGALPDAAGAGDLSRAQLETVPRLPGLYGLLGLGARGLVWAAGGAELIASELEGEPLPLEADLAAAVDPARFLLRAARRGRLRWMGEEDA